ncbi:hypothetical protein [Pseudoalteromonas sp. S558]|uniref:hypothetical protein n=1 Tax=Pseudoalteromonas sp. S558 TaxID=2066515 RepID=UPI00110B9EFD|nr:hypothetical protein [Pseudoalteromonas sp. S558]TMN94762.1 hypothetical protein CWB66_19095 [Pseudoalteromonas sp. S558]
MDKFKESILTEKINLAKKWCLITTVFKVVIAIIVCVAYFTNASCLPELIVFSVVLSLLLPLGFYGAFMENLLEYNTQAIEDRQLLNANEANEHFIKMSERITKLEDSI